MFGFDGVVQAFVDSMHYGVEIDFLNFLKNTHATKWIISADFVIGGSNRYNDTMVFTVFPYDAGFEDIMGEIRKASPHDIKKIKSVNESMLRMLSSRRRFSFCFIPNIERHNLTSLNSARVAIDDTIEIIQKWIDGGNKSYFLSRLQKLRQEAKSKRFNHSLLGDIVIMSTLASAIAYYIKKNTRSEHIAWFIDRDNMTTAFGGIAFDTMSMNFYALCEQIGHRTERTTLGNAIEMSEISGKSTWFDDLVRLPDFLAGTISRYDFKQNLIDAEHPKFTQVIQQAVSENPHIALIYLKFSIFGVRSSRVRIFNRENTNYQAYLPERDSILNYLTSQALGFLPLKRICFREAIMNATFLNHLNLNFWWR